MTKHFYSDLIVLDEVFIHIDRMDINDKQREHLKHLVGTTVHATVLDVVLSHMHEEDKHLFLDTLHDNDHEKIWDFLHVRTLNIEPKIKKAVKDLMHSLLEDIATSQKK